MLRVKLLVAGPRTGTLALYLQESLQFETESFDQSDFFRGWIIGRHNTPFELVGIGLNDGTYITKVEVFDVDDSDSDDEENYAL